MPKCNTGPDAIKKKKKKSCRCKHYAFTSPSLTSLLHSQQQAAISLVISSASSNVHLPVFNPLCSPSYHPMINPFPSTISQLPKSFPLSPYHIWLIDHSLLISVNIFKVYLGHDRLFFFSFLEVEGGGGGTCCSAGFGKPGQLQLNSPALCQEQPKQEHQKHLLMLFVLIFLESSHAHWNWF